MTGALRYEGNRQADFRFGDSILVTFLVFQPNKFLHCLSKGRNLTRGDNSGKTRNMRRLFFHEESIHEVSRRYFDAPCTHTHKHTHTDKPKPICPPLFQSWGHNQKYQKMSTKFRCVSEKGIT